MLRGSSSIFIFVMGEIQQIVHADGCHMLQERIGMLEPLLKENERLKNDNQSLLKSKGVSDAQAMALKKSLEVLQKEINDKEILVISSNISPGSGFHMLIFIQGSCMYLRSRI